MNTAKQEPLIQLNDLYMEYGGQKQSNLAVADISLFIYPGEFITVVGPSGCGKSTLLKMIAGYQTPTKGEVLAAGQLVQESHPKRGVVFQDPTLYPWLTVAKNIEYGPKRLGENEESCHRISHYLLKQIDLLAYENSYPYELSGGMKQRVAFARTLATQPEIILLDEPFSALDIYTRINMQNFLRQMWRQNNQTMLLITHDIEEALSLGTRVVVMNKNPGRIIAEYNIDFTNKLLDEVDYNTIEDQQFNRLKKELFEMIAK